MDQLHFGMVKKLKKLQHINGHVSYCVYVCVIVSSITHYDFCLYVVSITVFVRGPNDEDLTAFVSKIIFSLHPSFAIPVRGKFRIEVFMQ